MTDLNLLSHAELVTRLIREQASHEVTKAKLKGLTATLEALVKYQNILEGETLDTNNALNSSGPTQDPKDPHDDITMPRYKNRCRFEHEGRCTRVPECAYLHQSQIEKYSARVIEALYPNRKAEQQAHGRKG
jgi:hypothetical protein